MIRKLKQWLSTIQQISTKSVTTIHNILLNTKRPWHIVAMMTPLSDKDYRSYVTWVSEWLLFNANSVILQLYHGENKLISMRWWCPLCTRPTLLSQIFFIVNWNNSPLIDMSPHSDTLSWFCANQSLLFLLNAACLAKKQQIPFL